MNKIMGLGIAVGLGLSVFDNSLHGFFGWSLALGYYACFNLNESMIREMNRMKDEE